MNYDLETRKKTIQEFVDAFVECIEEEVLFSALKFAIDDPRVRNRYPGVCAKIRAAVRDE